VPLAELPQLAALAKKSRSGLVDGKVASGARAITFRDAIFEAVAAHAARATALRCGVRKTGTEAAPSASTAVLPNSSPATGCSMNRSRRR
jgi:hypothetical protein